MKKRRKRKTGLVMAAVAVWTAGAAVGWQTPMEVYGASPEFAYSEEKWASLRDDKLEYEEIADLIHEYNNTVVQNQIAYQDERDQNRDDVAQEYYDAAEQLYSNIEYPDSDDSSYGSKMVSALNSELQAEQLMENGDESVDDSETVRLGYEQTEYSLVKEAQTQMISYWSQYEQLDNLKEQILLAEAAYEQQELKVAAGVSTQTELLAAKETVQTAKASLQSTQSSLEKTKETLCLMLGWSYGAEVEIGALPETDLEAVSAIDLEQDIQKAQENNYSIRQTQKQVTNARTTKVKETKEQTLKSQKEAVASDVKDSYSSLLLAKSSYEQASQALELEQASLETANYKRQAGMLTDLELLQQESACRQAETTVILRRQSLLQAMTDYEWAVQGLASAS